MQPPVDNTVTTRCVYRSANDSLWHPNVAWDDGAFQLGPSDQSKARQLLERAVQLLRCPDLNLQLIANEEAATACAAGVSQGLGWGDIAAERESQRADESARAADLPGILTTPH